MRHDMCKGGSTSSRTEGGIPKIQSPAPNHRKNWISLDNQNMELPNSMIPKIAKTTPTIVLTRGCSRKGGGGELH